MAKASHLVVSGGWRRPGTEPGLSEDGTTTRLGQCQLGPLPGEDRAPTTLGEV